MLLVGKGHVITPKCKGEKLGNAMLVNIQEEYQMNFGTQLVGSTKAHFIYILKPHFFQYLECPYSLLPLVFTSEPPVHLAPMPPQVSIYGGFLSEFP